MRLNPFPWLWRHRGITATGILSAFLFVSCTQAMDENLHHSSGRFPGVLNVLMKTGSNVFATGAAIIDVGYSIMKHPVRWLGWSDNPKIITPKYIICENAELIKRDKEGDAQAKLFYNAALKYVEDDFAHLGRQDSWFYRQFNRLAVGNKLPVAVINIPDVNALDRYHLWKEGMPLGEYIGIRGIQAQYLDDRGNCGSNTFYRKAQISLKP